LQVIFSHNTPRGNSRNRSTKGKTIEPLLIPGLLPGRHLGFNYFDLYLLLVIRIFNCFAHNGFAFKKSSRA